MRTVMKSGAERLSAVVLAGTADLNRHDGDATARERLIEHVAWTLAQFPFERFAVIGGQTNGHSGLEVLPADQNGGGAGAAIATALRHLRGGILVAGGNMPFITVEMIEWLLGQDDPTADAVIPRHSDGVEPYFAIYSPGILPHLDTALSVAGDALSAALNTPSVRYVAAPARFDAEGKFRKVHSAEDYARALENIRRQFSLERFD